MRLIMILFVLGYVLRMLENTPSFPLLAPHFCTHINENPLSLTLGAMTATTPISDKRSIICRTKVTIVESHW